MLWAAKLTRWVGLSDLSRAPSASRSELMSMRLKRTLPGRICHLYGKRASCGSTERLVASTSKPVAAMWSAKVAPENELEPRIRNFFSVVMRGSRRWRKNDQSSEPQPNHRRRTQRPRGGLDFAAAIVKPLHDHVANDRLDVLGNLHVVDLEVNRYICERFGLATRVAEHRIAGHADAPRLLQRLEDAGRVAAARARDQHIAFPRQHGELVGENIFVTLVVAEAGQYGGIGAQRVCADARPPGFRERMEKTVGEVIGAAGAATIAGEEHLPPGPPAVEQVLAEKLDRLPVERLESPRQPSYVILEVRNRRVGGDSGAHLSTSFCIHFRLYQRSSSFRAPWLYMPTISLIASSTVLRGLKPVASRRSELTL